MKTHNPNKNRKLQLDVLLKLQKIKDKEKILKPPSEKQDWKRMERESWKPGDAVTKGWKKTVTKPEFCASACILREGGEVSMYWGELTNLKLGSLKQNGYPWQQVTNKKMEKKQKY